MKKNRTKYFFAGRVRLLYAYSRHQGMQWINMGYVGDEYSMIERR